MNSLPRLQILDALVPQSGDQLVETLKNDVRVGDRGAQDLSSGLHPAACCTWCAAAGGTVGGCASSGIDRAGTRQETWKAAFGCRIAAHGAALGSSGGCRVLNTASGSPPPGITASPGRYINMGKVAGFLLAFFIWQSLV